MAEALTDPTLWQHTLHFGWFDVPFWQFLLADILVSISVPLAAVILAIKAGSDG